MMNVALQIAALLSSAGRGVVTYEDLKLRGAPDYEHLLIAAMNGRTLLTNNWNDFKLLHGAWQRWSTAWGRHEPHYGILVLDQRVLPEQATQAILDFEQMNLPLHNQLYRWRFTVGWEHITE